MQNEADSNYVYDAIGNLVQDKVERIDTIQWTVYGKIREIIKSPTGQNPVERIQYGYDPSGNRISKLAAAGWALWSASWIGWIGGSVHQAPPLDKAEK